MSESPTQSPRPNKSPGSLYLFQAFGIEVYVHWSWFVIAIVFVEFMSMFSNSLWAAGAYVTLFAIVLLHEFGHALAAKSVGGIADHIVLWPLGGIAFVKPPARPGATLWTIAAGPLVNVALVPVTLVALWLVSPDLFGRFPWPGYQAINAAPDVEAFVFMVTYINLLLLVFNMMPIYPLDGGQILQSLLWFVVGRAQSLLIAASIGLGGAVLMGLGGYLVLRSIWLAVIAVFVAMQAWDGFQQARQMAHYERMRSGE